MTDPLTAAASLAEALGLFVRLPREFAGYTDLAAAIRAALPPGWCGHEVEVARLEALIAGLPYHRPWDVEEPHREYTCPVCMSEIPQRLIAELARLRPIEEAARAVLSADATAESGIDGADQRWDEALDALRAALEADSP